jgi:microcystin-dependent protein
MNGKRGRQVLAMKYIIRRIVALLVVAGIIAVPAVLGAYSFERDKDDNHNQIDSESNTLSYEQVEPHVRTYIDEEKIRITSDGVIESSEVAAVDESSDKDPSDEDASGEASADSDNNTSGSDNTPDKNATDKDGADIPVYDTPASVPDVATGTVLIYAGDKVPDGFLLCDGREVPRGRYPSLYKVIGDKYGEGDGVTTFNLPDMDTLMTNGTVGTVAAGDGDTANLVSAATGQMNRPLVSLVSTSAATGQMNRPLVSTPLASHSPAPLLSAANPIPAEFAFEQTGTQPATTPIHKTSEPTGPPPVLDPSEFNRDDTEEKPDSNPTAKGAKPTMYFIIKY